MCSDDAGRIAELERELKTFEEFVLVEQSRRIVYEKQNAGLEKRINGALSRLSNNGHEQQIYCGKDFTIADLKLLLGRQT